MHIDWKVRSTHCAVGQVTTALAVVVPVKRLRKGLLVTTQPIYLLIGQRIHHLRKSAQARRMTTIMA